MKITVVKDYSQMSMFAAIKLVEQIKFKPNSVLGLATGATPIGLYEKLVEFYKENKIDFSQVKSFNLDEYVGLGEDSEQSFISFMNNIFFKHINIKKENTFIPCGISENLIEECERYNLLLDTYGPIDIQILGIGINGHIGFNEPSDNLYLRTHIVSLTKETRQANARFFDGIKNVPKKAITMGIGDIMSAKKIIILASGKSKAQIIKQLTKTGISTFLPASILKLHKDIELIVDEDAASKLLIK